MITIDRRVKFDEVFENEEFETVTYYFTIEKSLLEEIFPNQYPEAVCGELSIEVPADSPEVKCASVEASPTEFDAENDCYTDYDWREIGLPDKEVELLIKMARQGCEEQDA